jgi:iron(III) transport system substrate-binding protein
MKRKNVLSGAVLVILALFALSGCGGRDRGADSKRVVIYTSTEDFRTEHMEELIKAKFPGYDIVPMERLSTGNHAAKLKAEGLQTEADIILNLETGYMDSLADNFADLSSFDLSPFLDELVPASKKYLPWDKSSGAIVFNREKLESLGLPVPASYRDLLNPAYRGQISMPSPKSSGTGYMFLVSLINAWGEDEAFAYFEQLAKNILQFTTSGSGPVNALVQGEAAIGLGMTLTAVQAVNSRGVPLEAAFFSEGAPSITTGMALIKGKDARPIVREVFEFCMTTLNREDKELYCPEPVYKNQPNNIANYPREIPYADMTGVYDQDLKARLLERWTF